jgi:hypothetical protein
MTDLMGLEGLQSDERNALIANLSAITGTLHVSLRISAAIADIEERANGV